MATAISTEWRTACIVHLCDFCELPIQPGECYRRDLGAEGGRAYSWKTDEACAALLTHVGYEVDAGSAYDWAEMSLDDPDCPEIVKARWVKRDGDVVDLRRESTKQRAEATIAALEMAP